nr:MAG TPA: hypothetical protein [Caudoviricetes sp.]
MAANFDPTINPINRLGAFKFWCQTTLPAVYDESLSYYELLCKVVATLNQLISNVNIEDDNINAINAAYKQLQNYVNNYFDNLSVQNEIDNKLDSMVEDGTLQQILAALLDEYTYPVIVDSVSEMTDQLRVYVLNDTGEIYTYTNGKFTSTGMIYGNTPFELRIIKMDATTAEGQYSKLASNLPAMSMAWINPNWFTDVPSNGTGFISTYGRSQGAIKNYGTQVYTNPTSKISKIRVYNSSENKWGEWADNNYNNALLYYGNQAELNLTDYNDATESGTYYLSTNATNMINGPTPINYPALLNVINDGNVIIQVVMNVGGKTQLYTRYKVNAEWRTWLNYISETMDEINDTFDTCLSLIGTSEPADVTTLAEIPPNRYSWKSSENYTDAPQSTGSFFIITLGNSNSTNLYIYGTQFAFYPSSNSMYYRQYNTSASTFNAWTQLPTKDVLIDGGIAENDLNDITTPGMYYLQIGAAVENQPFGYAGGYVLLVMSTNTVITQIAIDYTSGAVYTRYAVNGEWRSWSAGNNCDPSNKYVAFGDSTTYGQTPAGNQSSYNYPTSIGKALNMEVQNLAVGGQGLIADWSEIQSLISGTDFSDVRLVTVGWAYNDAGLYSTLNFGSYSDVNTNSFIGYYYNAMKLIQDEAPNASVILITGYGVGDAENGIFNHSYTFADGSKTTGEMYDELEKMCNSHGWCCINQHKGSWINDATWSDLIGDNIHPNAEGYKIYSDYIVGRIKSMFYNLY